MIPIVLVGAAGRMGRAIEETARGNPEYQIRARIESPEHLPKSREGSPWSSDLSAFAAPGVVVIEFSTPAVSAETASTCAARGAALVSGTTGLSPAEDAEVRDASRHVAVLRAANFSLGIQVLREAVAAALAAAPRDWDIEIVERHHRGKADSPSGTALQIARDAAAARGYPAESLRHGREGRMGPRPEAEIGVHALRGGSWVGDHSLLLAGPGEWLELRHVAQDRGAFAHGALAAARFVAGAPAGLYNLGQMIRAAAL